MDKLTLINMALRRCGVDDIPSLSDASKRGVVAVAQYEHTLNRLLSDCLWSFAKKRALLAQAGEPAFEYMAMYALPADYLKLIELPEALNWTIEDGFILTDTLEEIKIKYVAKVTETRFSPSFSHAMALSLASDICYSLNQSSELQKAIRDEAKDALSAAKSINAQESKAKDRETYTTEFVFSERY